MSNKIVLGFFLLSINKKLIDAVAAYSDSKIDMEANFLGFAK